MLESMNLLESENEDTRYYQNLISGRTIENENRLISSERLLYSRILGILIHVCEVHVQLGQSDYE